MKKPLTRCAKKEKISVKKWGWWGFTTREDHLFLPQLLLDGPFYFSHDNDFEHGVTRCTLQSVRPRYLSRCSPVPSSFDETGRTGDLWIVRIKTGQFRSPWRTKSNHQFGCKGSSQQIHSLSSLFQFASCQICLCGPWHRISRYTDCKT